MWDNKNNLLKCIISSSGSSGAESLGLPSRQLQRQKMNEIFGLRF